MVAAGFQVVYRNVPEMDSVGGPWGWEGGGEEGSREPGVHCCCDRLVEWITCSLRDWVGLGLRHIIPLDWIAG